MQKWRLMSLSGLVLYRQGLGCDLFLRFLRGGAKAGYYESLIFWRAWEVILGIKKAANSCFLEDMDYFF